MIELITVTCGADLANLYFQALSLKKFWKDSKEWTIVVEDEDSKKTIEWCKTNILPSMLDWKIDIISTPTIVTMKNGWDRQQLLKLWFAKESKKEYSLILDSKNFFVRPALENDFVSSGTVYVQLKPNEQPNKQFQKTCKICNIDPSKVIVPYTTTPWVWKNSTIAGVWDFLINKVNVTTKQRLPIFEFETVWCLTHDKINWKEKKLSDGVYADSISLEEINRRINDTIYFKIPVWVFHRYHWNNKLLCDISNSFLKEIGLIDDKDVKFWNERNKIQAKEYPHKMQRC